MTQWLRPIGVGLVLVAALAYQSAESRPVLARWSVMYTILLGLLLSLLLAAVWVASRRVGSDDPAERGRRVVLDGSVFAFGLGYLIGGGSGRIADLDLFGSTHGGAVVLEWVAAAGFVSWGIWTLLARSKSDLGKGMVTVVGAFATLALVAEGAFRFQAVFSPRVEGVPSVSTRRWLERHVQRNSIGFRDVEPPADPDPARRVLIVGDSFAMGWGLPDTEARFGERLALGLARRTGIPWRPITIAEANRHTLDEIKMVGKGVAYCPDLVVLVYVFNDIDYLRLPDSAAPGWAQLGSIPLGLAFVNSHLVQKATLMLRMALSNQADAMIARSPYADSGLVTRHLEDLRRFVEVAESRGAQAVIVPFEVTAVAVPAAAERHHRFVALAQRRGLPVLAIDTAFQGKSIEELTISWWDRHPSAIAHHLAADAVASRLSMAPSPGRPGCARGA